MLFDNFFWINSYLRGSKCEIHAKYIYMDYKFLTHAKYIYMDCKFVTLCEYLFLLFTFK